MNTTRLTLIQRVQDPENQDAWKTFSTAYQDYITSILVKVGVKPNEVDDLSQDILLILWKQLPKFDYKPHEVKFRTWLYSVIRNTALSYFRSKNSEQKRIKKYFDSELGDTDLLDQLMHEEWKSYLCQKALKNIQETFTTQSIEVFQNALKGSSVQQLAEQFNLKENTIYRIKNRVKEHLVVEIRRLRNDLE
ncbi:sigma-70 family RNA polymerase sigma factor [Rubritalea spongiae]|uniref:Sigma-70 family RNA polymerase sigma factor n=2 Tax=Rubritalea spongiae TaxID=430797 RepID=A0ABW5E6F6_9BACT